MTIRPLTVKSVWARSSQRWLTRNLVVVSMIFIASIAAGLTLSQPTFAAGNGGPITGIAGKCLANQNGTAANGNPVQLEDCVSDARQVWSWTGDKTVRVQGFCLEVQSSGTTPGTPVRLWTCNSSSGAQQWRPMANGSLINVSSGLCLETVGNASTNGTTVQLGSCSGSAAGQNWNISQAIITLDPVALAPHAPLPTGTTHTPKPTITLDYAMAPELKDWAESVAKPLVEDWYPVVVEYYAYPHHHSQVRNSFTIKLDPTYSGVAVVDNLATTSTIRISSDYVRTHMNDGGMLIHESTHISQWNPNRQDAGLPSWIIEGWADHAREAIYQDRPLRQPINDETIFRGYSPASLMLNEAEQANGTNFLKEMSARGWQGAYSNGMFAEVAGSSLGSLWYAKTGQASSDPGRMIHAITGKCVDLPSFATEDGTLMQIQGCNGSQAQDWIFKATTAGAKTGIIVSYGSKCLAVTGNATVNGSPVSYRTCASSANAGQKWEYIGGTFKNPNSGKCLQPIAGATADGTKLEIQPCNGSLTQQWTLPTIYKAAPTVVTSKVLYAGTFPNAQQGIGTTDAKGTGYNRILTAPSGSTYAKPNLSPNGALVAYLQTTTGQQSATLRKANADGSSDSQLALADYYISTSAPKPIWSSDSSRILVAVTPTGQVATDKQWTWLWVNADGTSQQVVSEAVIGGTPFAVAGGKIYFINDNSGEQQLCTVSDADGTGKSCVGSALQPKSVALSPDSARIASVAEGTTTTIQVTTVSEGATSPLSLSGLGSGLTNVEEVTWVPGTSKVAFRATVNGRAAWYSIDAVNPGQINKLNIDANAITWYASAAPALKQGSYNGLTPFRITDTRAGSGQLNAGKTLTAGGSLDIQVAGLGGVPAEGASAVVLNITEAATSSNGFVSVWPTGSTRPISSTLNNTPNKILNNQTTVGLGVDGKVSIFNQLGNTDMVVDVVGYYGETGGSFVPTAPKRVIDTRSGAPVAAWSTLNVQVTGVQGIPANATGIVADVTEVGAAGTGFLTLYPAGTSLPTASSMNFYPNETLTKEVNARLSAGGAVAVTNSSNGTTHFIIDVVGYYTNDMGGMAYTPINPSRIADTRAGSGQPYAGQPLTGGMTKLFTVGSNLMPANATSVINNMTVASGTAGNFLTAFPASSGTVPPGTSITHVNPVSFNQSTVQLSSGPTGGFKVFNNTGTTELILDSLGYYF